MRLDYYNDNDPGSVAWLEALCAAFIEAFARSIIDIGGGNA